MAAPLNDILSLAASGMSAQAIRLNIAASNMANANTVASSEEKAYHAKQPVFESVLSQAQKGFGQSATSGVRVAEVTHSKQPIQAEYQPGNPKADKNGYVYKSNVNTMEQMASVIEASRDYQKNVQIMKSAKRLIDMTIAKLGE